MTYKLKGGESVKNGKLYGWTGNKCEKCRGCGRCGEGYACSGCGGTGDEWGLMPEQPADLPPETLLVEFIGNVHDLINGPPGPHVSQDEAAAWDYMVRLKLSVLLIEVKQHYKLEMP